MALMAIYHLSVKTVSRSAGRSATAAAAYRAGIEIVDERTGEIYDYSRRRGVESANIVLPDLPDGAPEWVTDRAKLWNAVEQAETRKNSTVAREFEIALPEELSPVERQRLALDFAREIVERHGCVADVAIHAPGKKGDNRNHHAHILLSTRRLGPAGFTEKTRELDSGGHVVTQWRERFANLENERLREAGHDARVDHRSHKARGIEELPGQHHGPAVSGLLARGEQSHMADRVVEQAAALLASQLADAQAAAELLRRQALEAEDDVQREMEAEWIQAELAQEAEDQAEREAQFDQLADEQAAEDAAAAAAAAAQREAAARAEREKTEREAAERAEAVAAITAAEAVVRQAEQAEQAAAERLDQLRPAKDFAAAGLDRSGHSMLESIKAMPKVSAWQKAIADFDQAQTVWQKAAAVLASARQVLASAWQRLEMLDARVQQARQAQADALKAQAAAQQKGRAMAAKQAQAAQWARGMRGTIQDTRQRIEQERERHQGRERDAPDVPAPRM